MAEANLISGLHMGMLSTPMLIDARTAQDFQGLMKACPSSRPGGKCCSLQGIVCVTQQHRIALTGSRIIHGLKDSLTKTVNCAEAWGI